MTASWGGPLEFHNIQEIVDIELMFELICMFFFYFIYMFLFIIIAKLLLHYYMISISNVLIEMID